MRRTPRVILAAVLLLTAAASPARTQSAEESPAPPAPVASPRPDRLEEFVPHERVKADSAVAMPVDL